MATVFGYGTGGYGSLGFGVGSTFVIALNLADAFAVRENVVRVVFDSPPRYTGMLDPFDASVPAYFAVKPVAGTSDNNGNAARAVSVIEVNAVEGNPNALDLILDRAMTGYPAQYGLTVNPNSVVSYDYGPLSAAESPLFYGVRQGRPHTTPEYILSNRDIANPNSNAGLPIAEGESAKLGVFNVNGQGDVAYDEGLIGLRKRMLRRLSTKRGTYAHLPGYGVLALGGVQQLARPGLREVFAVDAESQIKQEPEVVQASVVIDYNPDLPSIVIYRVKAKTRFGKTLELIHRVSAEEVNK